MSIHKSHKKRLSPVIRNCWPLNSSSSAVQEGKSRNSGASGLRKDDTLQRPFSHEKPLPVLHQSHLCSELQRVQTEPLLVPIETMAALSPDETERQSAREFLGVPFEA